MTLYISSADETKKEFLSYIDMLRKHTKTDSERAKITDGANCILSNWNAAKVRLMNCRESLWVQRGRRRLFS